jgi:hypothetical protein
MLVLGMQDHYVIWTKVVALLMLFAGQCRGVWEE